MTMARPKRQGATAAAPAISTKILNGVGGGSSDGTTTASRPKRW